MKILEALPSKGNGKPRDTWASALLAEIPVGVPMQINKGEDFPEDVKTPSMALRHAAKARNRKITIRNMENGNLAIEIR